MPPNNELIHNRPTNALTGLCKQQKLDLMSGRNISINTRSVDVETSNLCIDVAEELGFTPFDFSTVFVGMASYLLRKRVLLPEKVKQKNRVVNSLFSGARIIKDETGKIVVIFDQDEAVETEETEILIKRKKKNMLLN